MLPSTIREKVEAVIHVYDLLLLLIYFHSRDVNLNLLLQRRHVNHFLLQFHWFVYFITSLGVLLFCDNREFENLRRLLQRKRHNNLELLISLSVLRLFHVVQNRQSTLSFASHEWLSCKGRERKIYSCGFSLSSDPQIWTFHVVIWQTTSKNCTKGRVARAAQIFFLVQSIKS